MTCLTLLTITLTWKTSVMVCRLVRILTSLSRAVLASLRAPPRLLSLLDSLTIDLRSSNDYSRITDIMKIKPFAIEKHAWWIFCMVWLTRSIKLHYYKKKRKTYPHACLPLCCEVLNKPIYQKIYFYKLLQSQLLYKEWVYHFEKNF